LTLEPNRPAVLLGSYYARSLDYWGVELEKAALLPQAGKVFEQALQLNPGSVAARINAQFNRDLSAGKKIVIEPPGDVLDSFGKHRDWTDLLNSDGPFDNPSFCYMLGVAFAAGENYRPGTQPPQGKANYLQAIQQFERVRALAPDYPDAAYWLCQLYLRFRKSSEALTIADQVLKHAPDDPTALYYSSVALMQLGSYNQALKPLNHLLALQTNNYTALLERAISNLQLTNYPAAKADYESLLKVAPKAYQIDYGLQEIAYHQKDTNALANYLKLYLTNYYGSFPTNYTPPETEELKIIKQRLKELKNGAP
jgi:tetratricopeptide (TPR) repeat protein